MEPRGPLGMIFSLKEISRTLILFKDDTCKQLTLLTTSINKVCSEHSTLKTKCENNAQEINRISCALEDLKENYKKNPDEPGSTIKAGGSVANKKTTK